MNFATASSDPLSMYSAGVRNINDGTNDTKDTDDRLAAKLALSLVSKAWREIALEFLFKSLVIDLNVLSWDTPRHTMTKSLQGPFRFVKHIMVSGYLPDPPTEEAFVSLMRVLKLCRNLIIFQQVSDFLHTCPPFLYDTLFATCGPSLRRLDLDHYLELPLDFLSLLKKRPVLNIL